MVSIKYKKDIWVAKPVYSKDMGTTNIDGYTDLQFIKDVVVVPASSNDDIVLYGKSVTDILKFHVERKSIDIENGDMIFFSLPEKDKVTDYYDNGEYVVRRYRVLGNKCIFDGEKI